MGTTGTCKPGIVGTTLTQVYFLHVAGVMGKGLVVAVVTLTFASSGLARSDQGSV